VRWLWSVVGAVLVGVAVGLYFLYSTTEIERALNRGEWVHILFVGEDAVPDRGPEADAIALLGISPDPNGPVPYFFLSFPPNLLCYYEGEWKPLRDLYRRGDLTALIAAVEALAEVRVDRYVVVDYADFEALVDALGGVELVVEKNLSYVDQSQDLIIDIPAGKQLLDGRHALQYVRYREGEDEFGRLRRQQKFLWALVEKLRARGLGAAKALIKLLLDGGVDTDIDFLEALYLARRLWNVPLERKLFGLVPAQLSPEGYKPDFVGLRKILTGWAEEKRFYTRDEIVLVVLNGSGERFLARRAGVWLEGRGFRVVREGWADRRDYTQTVLVELTDDARKEELILEVLKLRAPSVEVVPAAEFPGTLPEPMPEGVDFVVILGKGFRLGG
jgi:LCP family protein required for cell wall assembly